MGVLKEGTKDEIAKWLHDQKFPYVREVYNMITESEKRSKSKKWCLEVDIKITPSECEAGYRAERSSAVKKHNTKDYVCNQKCAGDCHE